MERKNLPPALREGDSRKALTEENRARSASGLAMIDSLFQKWPSFSKWFLRASPAGHEGHENGGKNYHQEANNSPRNIQICRFALTALASFVITVAVGPCA